jgi:hypothetical protein
MQSIQHRFREHNNARPQPMVAIIIAALARVLI